MAEVALIFGRRGRGWWRAGRVIRSGRQRVSGVGENGRKQVPRCARNDNQKSKSKSKSKSNSKSKGNSKGKSEDAGSGRYWSGFGFLCELAWGGGGFAED
jgi:hypothetical protein